MVNFAIITIFQYLLHNVLNEKCVWFFFILKSFQFVDVLKLTLLAEPTYFVGFFMSPSHSCDQILWVGVRRRESFIVKKSNKFGMLHL